MNDGRGSPGGAIRAITFDFGNTLVPFTDGQLRSTVGRFAVLVETADRSIRRDELIALWAEERDRQVREDVPQGLEADLPTRAARVLARLRGCPAPEAGARWAQEAASAYSTPEEIDRIVETYAQAFVGTTPVPDEIGPMLERLARRHSLAIVSNWPLTAAIERYVEAAGWRPHFDAVVVSHAVGCIKPWPGIFEAAATALRLESGPSLLHVGDDLAADVGGAQALGWRAAWVSRRPHDSPLPVARVEHDIRPDLQIESVLDLESALDTLEP